ncbi:MAG: xanthine dehydrogenase family protein molybdopterin-binding subunit [Burkholderiales bacterium]|nr:xanthine dehydrogenase family protein molybdopterin-binding subunit [Burkholderiales bacterium]
MNWIGRSIKRVEDERLLRGEGRFLADLRQPGTLEAIFVRSPHAHAAVRGIDIAAARAAPGVVAVFTARDTAGRTAPVCVAGEVHTPERLLRELKPLDRVHPTPLFPAERVTYVGQPIALVVAERRAQALDAAELVAVDYEPLPAVTDAAAALAPGAPLVEPEWGSNLALSVGIRKGDPDAAFAGAPVVVEEEFTSHRYVAAPLETRGIQATMDPVTGQLTVWASTQTAHVLQGLIAVSLRMPPDRVRVIACDVGGGFGQKGVQSVEDMLVAFAARELGRTVRWVEQRGENLVAAPHARDQVAPHRGRGDRGRPHPRAARRGDHELRRLQLPRHGGAVQLAVAPARAVRRAARVDPGAGRAHQHVLHDRVSRRRPSRGGIRDGAHHRAARRAARPRAGRRARAKPRAEGGDALRHRPPVPRRLRAGLRFGRFRGAVAPRAQADRAGGRARRQRAPAPDGRLIGVGFALYVEGTGMGPFEGATVRVQPSGRVHIATGACSSGQGHRTTYAQIAADVLAVPIEAIDVVGGDTAAVPYGIGTIASRSTVTAGNAVHQASQLVRDRLLAIAAEMLETATADLELADGKVRLKGAPGRAVELAQISREATAAVLRRGAPGDGLLAETAYFRPPTVTYASAAHAVLVAVDPETGIVSIERYVVVHDCGRVVNPLLADAQIAGGVMQGIGGVLYEEMAYDAQGQALSGSFMDYAIPIAAQAPPLVLDHIENPSPRNPLGVKGLGEGGAIGPPAAIANAVEDALRPLGVVVRRGPLTPARVRELIRNSSQRGGAA